MFPDLDSEDEIIKNMKDEGYRDHLVAERLAREDRVAYNPKSIATRYARINRVLEQNLNKRLEDEESDWHEGDVSNRFGFSLGGSLVNGTNSHSVGWAPRSGNGKA